MVNVKRVCAVKSCPIGRKNSKKATIASGEISFFKPITPTKLHSWSESLGIPLKSTDSICQMHFKPKHMNIYSKIVIGDVINLHELRRKTLKPDALPTVEHQFQSISEQHVVKEQISHQMEKKFNKVELESENSLQEQSKRLDLEPETSLKGKENVPEHPKHNVDTIMEHNYHNQQSEKPLESLVQTYQHFLPQHWAYMPKPDGIEYIRLDPQTLQIKNHIIVEDDLKISVIYPNGEKRSVDDKLVSALPEDIYKYLKTVEKWNLCVGTQIEKQSYSNECKGVIVGTDAYKRNQVNPRCPPCRVLRNRLKVKKSSCSG